VWGTPGGLCAPVGSVAARVGDPGGEGSLGPGCMGELMGGVGGVPKQTLGSAQPTGAQWMSAW